MRAAPSLFAEVIKACERAKGPGSKDIIHSALAIASPDARRLIFEALNPYRVFGIKKFDMPKNFSAVDEDDIRPFFWLLDKLALRELTGTAARMAITAELAKFTKDTASYLARVINKDLKAGFSADTFNEVLIAKAKGGDLKDSIKKVKKLLKLRPTYDQFSDLSCYNELIPIFNVMLAKKCETEDEFETSVVFPCQADWKFDGERNITFVTTKEIIHYSRSGKVAHHVEMLFDEELYRIHHHLGYDYVLDAERFGSDFKQTTNAKKSGASDAKDALRLKAFFLMPLKHWKDRKTDITMRENRQQLAKILEHCKCEKILLSDGREVADYDDMMSYLREAIDVHKQEGLILKRWDATYFWDRSFDWTKVKDTHDADMRVIGFYKGERGTKNENRLGGVHTIGFLEDGTKVRADIGGGFSDKERDYIWNHQDEFLGKTITAWYQEISEAKGKDLPALRFNRKKCFRDDKVVEID